MKATQLYRELNGVLALHYVSLMLIWLSVIFREHFMEDRLTVLCCNLPWNFHSISFVCWHENWLQLKLKTDSFCWVFYSPICWQKCCSRAKKNVSLNLFDKVRDEVQNVFVKSFQSRSELSALLKIGARCRRRTWLNGRLEWDDRRLTEQNYRHVTELICSQEGNTGSSRSRREMINLTAISLSSGAARSCHGHKHVITNVFSHCVNMLLGCFDYIVIFLYKIVTH